MRFRRRLLAAAVLSTCLVVLPTLVGWGQESRRPTSLQVVPQTAAFYYASMNHNAQYQAVVNSNAWRQLMDSTIANRMRKAYRSGLRRGWDQFGSGNPFAAYLKGYHESIGNAPAKIALNIVSQVVGNEIFVYADEDWVDMTEAIQRFYQGYSDSVRELGEFDLHEIMDIAKQELTDVNTPTVVVGAVLDDPEQVLGLLGTLEATLDQVVNRLPPEMENIREAYEVIDEDGLYCLHLNLHEGLVPWSQLKDDPDIGAYVDVIRELMVDKTISVSLGIKGQFLFFSIGPSLDHIRNLGSGPLLIDHEKCATLRQAAADHPLTGVQYLSDAAAISRHNAMPGTVDSLTSMARMYVSIAEQNGSVAGGLDGLLDDLDADAIELKSDLPVMFPRPGTWLAYSFLSDEGIEGYVRNWAKTPFLDGSRPLELLNHVGPRPALAVVARDSKHQQQMELVRKWLGRGFYYAQEYVPRAIEDEQRRETFTTFMTELRPALSEFANATSEDFLPATSGGGSAFVLDMTSRKNNWRSSMPVADEPLPFPAVGLVIEINDRDKVRSAGSRYLQVVSDVFEIVRRLPDTNIPSDLYVNPPRQTSVDGNDMYYYPLPESAGLDPEISPNAMLGERLLVLSTSTEQSRRLMESTTHPFAGPLHTDRNRPLMAAFWYDNVELVDALHVWCGYALQLADDDGYSPAKQLEGDSDELSFSKSEIQESLERVAALLKCFHSFSSVTYLEDDVQVTHYLMKFVDVPANDDRLD